MLFLEFQGDEEILGMGLGDHEGTVEQVANAFGVGAQLANELGPFGEGAGGIGADQSVALRFLDHAAVAELSHRGERDDTVDRALLAAQEQFATLGRAAVASVEKHVGIHEDCRAADDVLEVHCSKGSSSMDSRNCSLVRLKSGALR